MYCDFFNFKEKPFTMTPDPRFLFMTDSHREAIASMVYGISERMGFILISGEVGTGKTTILHYLRKILDPQVNVVYICQTQITFEDILKEILMQLKLPVGDDSIPIMSRQLNFYLQKSIDQGENVVLLIDEAQHLSKEVLEGLRMLSNMETSEAKLLQIVLVGQPEIERKLNSEDLRQLKQRMGIRRKLRTVTEEEARQYIEHRLNKVGSASSAVFTPEAVDLICKNSEGILRNVNVLCDNSFLIAYGLGKRMADGAVVREVLGDMGITPSGEPPMEPARPHPPAVPRPRPVPQAASEVFLMAHEAKGGPAHRGLFPRALYLLLGAIGLLVAFFLGAGYFAGPSPTPVKKFSVNPPGTAEKASPAGPEMKVEPSAVVPSSPTPVEKPSPESRRPEPVSSLPKAAADVVSAPGKIIEVTLGDTLFSICQQYYDRANMTLVDHILGFNPEIGNMDLIKVSQKIKIPGINEESFLNGSPGSGYKVHLGTFEYPQSAIRYRNESVFKGKNTEVVPREVSPGITWYRLVAGKFETQEEALNTIQQLKKMNLLPAFAKKR
jgi:general secretion pathway protein A